MLLYSNFKWTYVQHTTPCYSFLIISQGGLSYNFYFWFLESEVIFLGQSYQSKNRLEYSAAHDWPSSNWLKVSASTTLDCKAIAVCFFETISLWHIFFFFTIQDSTELLLLWFYSYINCGCMLQLNHHPVETTSLFVVGFLNSECK